MSRIRVLLADDHRLVREGLRSILTEGAPDIEVVAEAADGREALTLTAAHHPHVVLTDISMPELNGLETTTRLTRDHLSVSVIVLSMHASEEYVGQALLAGASGYLLKDAAPDELINAIRIVARGGKYLTPAVSDKLITEYVRRASGEVLPEPLTPRQREILQLIAEGCTNKEIASRLDVSVKTVESHRTQLMKRLDIRDVAGLVRYAIRIGLIQSHS